MNEARLAMDKAKNLQAESLAPTDFRKAEKSWDHAQATDREGNTDAAKVLFTSAKIQFGKAADIAKSKGDALSRELGNMQLMISKNSDQVKIDLSKGNVSPDRRARVKAIMAEVEKSKKSINESVKQEDLPQAVATAREVQTKIYHAQLILAGKEPK